MGEVFLAHDPVCGRNVALKRIRSELRDNATIRSRFLREARVASALAHPSIIPILEIQTHPPDIYYTMPYVEGETLRQILRLARENNQTNAHIHAIGGSIPALARIFLQVCEAIAYTHAKGILHRDLKPENIIVGKYGEVMILDWGIADFIDRLESDASLPEMGVKESTEDLTRPGKITGTLAYMAPERLKGQSSSVQTDLYAMGVILYQLLTLQLPFQRKTIATFRKRVDNEQMIDPSEVAPYREIPRQLAAICNRCLMKDPTDRFQSVEQLIGELKNYIEGRPEWMFAAELRLKEKSDWQFQENVLLAKNLAITRNFDVTQWAALSVSNASFADNLYLEIEVKVHQKSEGIGVLLNVPSAGERGSLEEGYCLWIGTESHPSCQLFRNNVQVLESTDVFLSPKRTHHLRIEKIDDHVRFYLDGALNLSFASHLPLPGKHVGLLAKDDRFEITQFQVFDSSNNATIGCLAVPNAFLSHRLFDVALQEYRRIGQCFPGRMEGREALFRAGLTLLEKAKAVGDNTLYPAALKEFEKLYRTPGAPLEYLGKSLVYAATDDVEEEAKCLELALRKFPHHPLLPILKEHIVYRMHESSLECREAAYRIILLAIRHIPDLLQNPDTRGLLKSLKENWETLWFIEQKPKDPLVETAILLAFWLAKVPILVEMMPQIASDEVSLSNALYCLLELEAAAEVETTLQELSQDTLSPTKQRSLRIALLAAQGSFEMSAKEALRAADSLFFEKETRAIVFFSTQALKKGEYALVRKLLTELKKRKLLAPGNPLFEALDLWALLLEHKWKDAAAMIAKIPSSLLCQETSPLHFPYGCWLYASQGTKMGLSHFSLVLDTPYPPTTALPSYFLTGRIDEKKGWTEHAFWWEKKELHRQIDLFYKVIGKTC